MKPSIAPLISALLPLLFCSMSALAWGPDGHAAISILTLPRIDSKARSNLSAIVGELTVKRLNALCDWPDKIRDNPQWNWALRQHYVNIPRSETHYDEDRDCRDGLCVTEAIPKYAAELADDRLDRQQREQAFAWLCHLVGDLHQPLHCGFADDRGGNEVDVSFAGEAINLHQFWDSKLIKKRRVEFQAMLSGVSPGINTITTVHCSPTEVIDWTDQSHAMAGQMAYPNTSIVSEEFADQSWQIIVQQLLLAADRLALILNAVLGEGEVGVSPASSD